MLSQEQLDNIIGKHGLVESAQKAKQQPMPTAGEGPRGVDFLKTLKTKEVSTGQEKITEANELIERLKVDLETKFERGELGGLPEERKERVQEKVAAGIKEDIRGTADILQEGAGEILKAIPREMVRPFVSFVQGIQGLIPGGKTGEERVEVPVLGEIKPISEMTPLEAGVSALELSPLAGKAIGRAVERGFSVVTKPGRVVAGKLRGAGDTLEQTISPKLTIKRKGELIKKGLVEKGEAVPLVGKAPDIIRAGKTEQAIADTFRKSIKNAEKLDEFQLVTKAGDSIADIAKTIRPVLKKIGFSEGSKKEILNSVDDIIEQQKKDPLFFTKKTSNAAFQKQFKEFMGSMDNKIKDIDTGKLRDWTMEDVWDLRISYDDIVSKTVKNSTENSSELLQYQKDMWLQNRRLLNEWLFDKVPSQEFRDMSNLYEGINNIVTKGNVDIKGEPSIIGKFLTLPTRIVR